MHQPPRPNRSPSIAVFGFNRVPEGLHKEIEAIGDVETLARLHRAAIRSADLEAFAAEL